jgi:hypothetical protein
MTVSAHRTDSEAVGAHIEAIHTYEGTETMQTLIVAATSPASERLPSGISGPAE